jgi:perosamine synthetase
MSFNFVTNTQKNFKFIKSINSVVYLYICSFEIKNSLNGILIPMSKVNVQDSDTDYLSNENILKFLLQNKDDEILGEISIELIPKQEKLIFKTMNLDNNLKSNQFNEVVKIITKWCKNILLAENIEYSFDFEKENYNPPKELILTAGPMVSHYENIYTFDAVNHGWNNEWSKYIDKFETEFSRYVESKFAIATSSCTGALQLSLLSCGIGKGDEVIVPELTWVATASAVAYTGATPIFADVDVNTWCIDSSKLDNLITKNTKAIIPVHLYGNPANMDEIMKFANKYNLRVIEDAAPAIGATYKDKKVGSFGDFGCFSFQGAKLLVTGEGGMVVTNDENLFDKFKKIWDHGRIPGTFWIDELGYKYKMSNLQAAFGLGQLENIETLIESKRRNYERYRKNFSGIENININVAGKNTQSIYWMTSILLNSETGIQRDKIMEYLRHKNIDTRPVFPSISQYPIWGKKYKENKVAKLIGENGVNLPSGVNLTFDEIDYISDTVISFIESNI